MCKKKKLFAAGREGTAGWVGGATITGCGQKHNFHTCCTCGDVVYLYLYKSYTIVNGVAMQSADNILNNTKGGDERTDNENDIEQFDVIDLTWRG